MAPEDWAEFSNLIARERSSHERTRGRVVAFVFLLIGAVFALILRPGEFDGARGTAMGALLSFAGGGVLSLLNMQQRDGYLAVARSQ